MKNSFFLFTLPFFVIVSGAFSHSLQSLETYLAESPNNRSAIQSIPLAKNPLSKDQAEKAAQLLLTDFKTQFAEKYRKQWDAREMVYRDLTMKFEYKVFGEMPTDGRSLFISMHGGGNTSQRMNDQQWKNQVKLYSPAEGVYLAPRAPTNTWNLWHESHIDTFFSNIILSAILFENVNPDKVYIMGYSAGGDGVYQLAPRMADKLAAAAMMAGHPNETSPLGLRNIGFTLHMGGVDSAYQRNSIARRWGQMLDSLQKQDPGGYKHLVKVHEGKPHWMSRLDTVAVDWMAAFKRNPIPSKVVWKQDDMHKHNYYWLSLPPASANTGQEIIVSYQKNKINIHKNETDTLLIRLNDKMMNLNKPVRVYQEGKLIFRGKVPRRLSNIQKTIEEKGDAGLIFPAELTISGGKALPGINEDMKTP